MRVLAALVLMIASIACEPATASAPTEGAAIRRDIARAPERRTPDDATATPDLNEMMPPVEADEHSRGRVRFELRTGAGPQPFIPPDGLTIRFEDASGRRAIRGTALMPEEEGVFRSAWYLTETRGQLQIEVLVSDPEGWNERRTIQLELDDGRAWEVTLLRPTEHWLFECHQAHLAGVLALKGDDNCSIWPVWHRTRIGEPEAH